MRVAGGFNGVARLNVLLVTIGSAGDINPFLAIGHALRDRGHYASLITGVPFEGAAVEAGMAFGAVGVRC
jgi:rhamnosyltransferase subunit B